MSAFRSLVFAAAGAILIVASVPHDAEARGRRIEAQGARGGSGWSQVERGRFAPGEGFRNRQAEWTGAGGRTRSVDDQRAWSRADGTYSHDRDVEYRDGTSRIVDADVKRTAPGEYEFDRSVTGRNGETRTQSGTYTTTPKP
jgi:hypothetical protein